MDSATRAIYTRRRRKNYLRAAREELLRKENVEMLSTGRAIRHIELATHLLACLGTRVLILRNDAREISDRPGNIVLGIEFGLGLEVTIECQTLALSLPLAINMGEANLQK